MNSLEAEFLKGLDEKDVLRLQELIKHGFPVNRHIRREESSLGTHTYPLIVAIELGLGSIISQLLNAGANPNCFDSTGITPLLAASSVGNLEVLKLILQFRADLSARDFFGNTILHISAVHAQLNVVKYCIVDAKIPPIVKNRRGQTPLEACVEAQETAKSLDRTAKLQETIEYLWKVEDEFKTFRGKDGISKNSYTRKHPRFNLRDLAKISIMADEKKGVLLGSVDKRNVQSYLKAKHMAICYGEMFGKSSRSEEYENPTKAVRSASVKPFTNL
jgi:hypothetical protein